MDYTEAAGSGVVVQAAHAAPHQNEVLTEEACRFIADLERKFGARRQALLQRRQEVQARLDAGEPLGFLNETREIREASWKVAKIPEDLLDRRVEITGPVDSKMIINALNSGANVFMADFEDANSPTWLNQIEGQRNLSEAVRGHLRFTAENGKQYALGDRLATLMVRPRGWHLPEAHFHVDGAPMSGSLFDFGLFFFHNAKALLAKGTGPYFYLPKLESHLEARLWNDVFVWAQERLGIPRGTVRATVLIETLPAAFEMDEILHELREHSAGLNCGRWDYIFSYIKKQQAHRRALLPDRGQVTMDKGFLRAYVQLLIRTCHRRGAHAMGGMAAQIPIKNDPAANEAALDEVRADKLREVNDGHDGTWVAHPGLIPVAKAEFDRVMTGPNQIDRTLADVSVSPEDLTRPVEGTRTEAGLRHSLKVGVRYLEAWLGGQGCVPLYNLMEDAATSEICRSQVWQWMRFGATLDDGKPLTRERFERTLDSAMDEVAKEVGETRFERGHFDEAKTIFSRLVCSERCEDFLTLPAYASLLALAS